jgi:hypothetical protein
LLSSALLRSRGCLVGGPFVAHRVVDDMIVIFHDLALRFGALEAGPRQTPLCGRETLMTAKRIPMQECAGLAAVRPERMRAAGGA